MKQIHLIVAARPNFMKMGPVWHALNERSGYDLRMVHTGQHYDYRMSQQFLEELSLPEPSVNLEAGSGSHAVQTAAVMVAYEQYLEANRPDLVIVPGDVNSTLACALTAAKLHIPVAHLEAGLRSRDRTMPEELNRILTDSLADILWTPSEDGDANLLAENVEASRITLVGNCMIDSLRRMEPVIDQRQAWASLGGQERGYGLVTMHRPGNTDDPTRLQILVDSLASVSSDLPLYLPLHPRTRRQLDEMGLYSRLTGKTNVTVIDPLGYVDFLSLTKGAALVITDSGGIQEETTYLGIPCLTVRPNTERPVTCRLGTNQLVEPGSLVEAARKALSIKERKPCAVPLWDGKAAERVADDLETRLK